MLPRGAWYLLGTNALAWHTGETMRKTIEKAYPNRHGWVRLVEVSDPSEAIPWWYVREPGSTEPDDIVEFATLESARNYYNARLKHWLATPNWEAQAEYDAEHGTINGFAPWQYNREQ
jgi:hypothetical protein